MKATTIGKTVMFVMSDVLTQNTPVLSSGIPDYRAEKYL